MKADDLDDFVPYWLNLDHLKKVNKYVDTIWRDAVCHNYGCYTREFYKHFEMWKVYESDEDKSTYHACRTCWICAQEREGLETEGAARTWIAKNKSDYQRRERDNDQYVLAKKCALKFFAFMTPRRKGKATKILEKQESLIQVFAPLSEYIFIKDVQMSKAAEDWTEGQKLMKALTELKDSAKVMDTLERVMLLTAETPLLAFKDDPDQKRKFMATAYADEWCGCLGGWFRSW